MTEAPHGSQRATASAMAGVFVPSYVDGGQSQAEDQVIKQVRDRLSTLEGSREARYTKLRYRSYLREVSLTDSISKEGGGGNFRPQWLKRLEQRKEPVMVSTPQEGAKGKVQSKNKSKHEGA